jgi:prolyl 4-hydroxylase
MAFTVHHENPDVMTQDNFLTDKECEHFIKISKRLLKRAQVSSNKSGEISQGRTGKNCWIKHNHDEITLRIGEKIASEVGIPLSHAEAYQVIYYDKTEEYREHCDGWEHDNSEKSIRCMQYGGQRMTTALCYLNTVEKGGHTRMTKLDIDVSAEKGKLLIFSNVYKDTNIRDTLSEHAGTPVVEGEKWAFNLWFREIPKNESYYKDRKPLPPPVLNEDSTVSYLSNFSHMTHNKISDIDLIKENKHATVLKDDPTMVSFKNVINSDDVVKLLTLAYQQDKFKNYDTRAPRKNISNASNSIIKPIKAPISVINKPDAVISATTSETTSALNRKPSRVVCWIKNEDIPNLILKISTILKIDPEMFENICLTRYNRDNMHNCHHDAYDLYTDDGKKNTVIRGQRLYSVIGILNDLTSIDFVDLDLKLNLNPGDLLFYKNIGDSLDRNPLLRKKIENRNDNGVIVISIYVREYSSDKKKKISIDGFNFNLNTDLIANDIALCKKNSVTIISNEDHMQTLEEVYELFENGNMSMAGHKGMHFINKVKWGEVCESAKQLYALRKKAPLLNQESFKQTFHFDEFNPVCHNNAFTDEATEFFREYFRKHIADGSYVLGDRQSKLRYKGNDESLSRLLHYELLPLIEHVTKKKLRPTYTYMAGYTKGGDLPAHTDREDCQYTVSVVLDKPDGVSWPIYFDPVKQKGKNKGRVKTVSKKEDCISCDTGAGGFMMFNGEDHAHFREPLEHEFYTVLLCHYRRIEPQPQEDDSDEDSVLL